MTNNTNETIGRPSRRWPLGLTSRQGIIMTVLVLGGLVVGAVAGGAIGAAVITPQVTALEQTATERDQTIAALETAVKVAEGGRDRAEKEMGTVLDQTAAREAAVIKRESAVKTREDAVTASEQRVAANSFSGGLHVVGQNVQAGTYNSTGGSTCYYAWKSGTGADADIVDNNIVDGPATVTLRDGDVFESSRCGTWTKTG